VFFSFNIETAALINRLRWWQQSQGTVQEYKINWIYALL